MPALIKLPATSKLPGLAPAKLKDVAKTARKALDKASDPVEIMQVAVTLDAIENLMHAAGLFDLDDIIPVNQDRMLARWRLGRALKDSVGREQGKRTDKATSFPTETRLQELEEKYGLDRKGVMEAQRIAALPPDEREREFAKARKLGKVLHFIDLMLAARPHWAKVVRRAKHRKIAADAKGKMVLDHPGPFTLIYADPPWKWGHFGERDQENEMGKGRTPDQHYETLTHSEIINYKIDGKTVPEITHPDAVLLLWCTSSNIERAMEVMKAWGFEYKTQAMWDKMKTGLGLVFRNQHEVLLYGTRGNMPGPQYQPASVFRHKRTKHSAKPVQVRKAIEKMFPDFDQQMRLELFAREKVRGWTTYGLEALISKAA